MPDFVPVGIVGVGTCLPERVVTNKELETMIETTDEWIVNRTGIRERRIARSEEATSDLAVQAARRALTSAGVEPDEVDLIIVATATPDHVFPATASLVQDQLGCSKAGAFDLSAGCTGFMYALVSGSTFVSGGNLGTVLVIGAETISKMLNWKDRSTCILFGDGAGAVVLREVPRSTGLLASYLGSDGSGGPLLQVPAGGSRMPNCHQTLDASLHCLHMNGREVYRFAVRVMGDAALDVVKRAGLNKEEIDLFIPHQANIRIIEAAAKRLGLSMDKVLVNVDRYGNTSSASVPIALDEALRSGRIKSGNNVVMVGFGAGLSWGAVVMKWQ
ncbi:MAG: beta-ketoacyl-ACP synthase III [Clostridia bacterium]|nr:beta-ketoacyl-ACP synthase III [Clostridia bacterium]